MTKYEFLGDLSRLLNDLSEEERKQALHYYEDYFADAGEDKEEDILRELGSPEKIAEQIKSDVSDNISYSEGEAHPTNPPQPYSAPSEEQTHDTSSDNSTGQGWSRASDTQGTQSDNNTTWNQSTQWESSTDQGQWEGGTTQRKSTYNDTKRRDDNILMIVILVITSPLWLSLVAGIGSLIVGIITAILGIFAAMILGGGGSAIGGVFTIVGGFIACIVGEIGAGLLTIGIGCLLTSIGSAVCYLGIWLCIKLFPWLWKELQHLVDWCSRKFNRKEQPI